jgi:uncharacterized protein
MMKDDSFHSDSQHSRLIHLKEALSGLLNLPVRRPATVIIIVLLITVAAGWNIRFLSFKTSIYDLVIEDIPEATDYHSFQKMFGSDDIIRVVAKGNNVFDPVFFSKISKLTDITSKIEGVRRVISLPTVKKDIDPGGQWGMEKFSAILASANLFEKNLFSVDNKTTALTLVIEKGVDENHVINELNKIIEEASKDIPLYQIGMPIVSQALAEYTKKDLTTILPLSFIIIIGILYLIFNNFRLVALPVACVITAMVWTFGIMSWAGISVSMLTMIVPVFIIAVGTAYALHICSKFVTSSQHAIDSKEAVISTFTEMTLPTILAVLTTSIGIGSIFLHRITAIREFAVFAVIGMLSMLVILLTLMPSLMLFIPITTLQNKKNRLLMFTDRIIHRIIRLDLTSQRTIFYAAAVFSLLCIAGIFRIQIETNPVDYFKKDTDVSIHFHDIYKDLSGSFPVNVIMESREEDYFENPDHIREIARLQEFIETLPGIDKTVSFADYMKLVNYAMNQYDPEFYRLPDESWEVSMLINNYKIMLGDDVLKSFMDPSFSKANILLFTHISSSAQFLETKKKIHTHVEKNFPGELSFTTTGVGMAISASSNHLVEGQINSLALTIVLVFSAMFVLFLSGKVGLAAVVTNFFPVLVTFGVMGWFGIELNMATALIAGIAIGLAVDDTIHYLVRYNREFKKDLDKDRALTDTLTHTGRPIIFTTLTIGIGFSMLLISSFSLTAVFGFLMVITLAAALIGDLVILPSLMLHVELVTAWDLLKLMPGPGGMSADIAHELNQPLNAIKMGSEYLNIMLQRGKKIREEDLTKVITEISVQVTRASGIIKQLSTFGEETNLKKEPVHINRSIRDTLSLLKHPLELENINTELDLEENLPRILGHNNRIGQVFYNIIINARDALIKRRKEDPNAPCIIKMTTRMENGFIIASIFDSGSGIPTHLKERIFEPFFTTGAQGKGKGLGLSVCNEIMRDYKGRIRVTSKKNVGTTFELVFPQINSEASS